MISQQEMLKRIDEYYENTSPEQFMSDLEEMNCLDLIEDAQGE